ncbi:MAG: helix-turn-helix domain-containing protein [Oscillospiraceae bacterium]|nr:helix-turn-helix domain-containing protein [Oscillospiraceae bacterium]
MENTIKTPKLTYSVVEAAEALGVSKTAMYQIIRTEGFPVIVLGNRRLIPIERFKHWIEERAAIGWQLN